MLNVLGTIIKSCWNINKLGVLNIVKSKEKELEHHIAVLKYQINYIGYRKNNRNCRIIKFN